MSRGVIRKLSRDSWGGTGASPEMSAAYVSFARKMGVAFQIVDDVHNFCDSPLWRKTRG